MFSDIHDCFCFLFCSCLKSFLLFFICVLIISLLDVYFFISTKIFYRRLACLPMRGKNSQYLCVSAMNIFCPFYKNQLCVNNVFFKFTFPMINKQSGDCVKTQFLVNFFFRGGGRF